MANVKDVFIEGTIPFDAGGSDIILRFFGQCTMPTYGLIVHVDREGTYIDNEWGGRTFMQRFLVSGTEAIRYEFLYKLNKEFARVGTVERYRTYDIEEGQ